MRTYPQFGEMLAQNMMRTRSAAPDLERAGHFQELGVLLMDLGRLYLAESDVLLAASGAAELPESEGMEWEGRSRGLGGA
ncbi:hypothetical protein [Lentzea sp. NPDC092896]|uniref:hypothetical protein n=1 Tax=Lentzea sp. NPDC092896 TaxID=3364127 RepID=UPI0038231659